MKRELTIGKGYVNDEIGLLREIVDLNHQSVSYKVYDLSTGVMGEGVHTCNKKQFMRWADREALQAETAGLEGRAINVTNEISDPIHNPDAELSLALFQQTNRYNLINR